MIEWWVVGIGIRERWHITERARRQLVMLRWTEQLGDGEVGCARGVVAPPLAIGGRLGQIHGGGNAVSSVGINPGLYAKKHQCASYSSFNGAASVEVSHSPAQSTGVKSPQ